MRKLELMAQSIADRMLYFKKREKEMRQTNGKWRWASLVERVRKSPIKGTVGTNEGVAEDQVRSALFQHAWGRASSWHLNVSALKSLPPFPLSQQLPPTPACCCSASPPWCVWARWPCGRFPIWGASSRDGSWSSKYVFPAQPEGRWLVHREDSTFY